MIVVCSKSEAAVRQLDEAIVLLFADHDPLAVRTLAAAAHGILADLVEHKFPASSWRAAIIEGLGPTRHAALTALNSAQNFLKHANRDPEGRLEFDEQDNDHVIFIATLECGELGHPLSYNMQAFQIWYLASYTESIGAETALVQRSRSAFPTLAVLDREERLRHGAEFMERLRPVFESELSNRLFKRTPDGAA